MESTFYLGGAGTVIVVLLFCVPAVQAARKNWQSTSKGRVLAIRSIEVVYLLLMPLEGFICYHALDNFGIEKPVLDWQYYLALISIPFIITGYFLSRILKEKLPPFLRVIILILLVMGIILCIGMLFRFYLIGFLGAVLIPSPGIIFSLLALPYFSLLPVIVLLATEAYILINHPIVELGIDKEYEK